MGEYAGEGDRATLETPWTSGGWRTPYHHLNNFPRRAFAWEYLRRQDKFREEWKHNTAHWRKAGQQGQLQIFEYNGEQRILSDCLFASGIDGDLRSTGVLWNSRICPSVLRLLALPSHAGGKVFSLSESPIPTTLLLMSDGTQHVLFQDGLRTLQLEVIGESLLCPVSLMSATAIDAALLAYHEPSLNCFYTYRAAGILSERFFPPDPHAQRLAFVLQALDGWLAGASHREIAIALYGDARVVRDWRDPGENLRDRVRYAIVRGRALSQQGYRTFLH